MVGGLVTGLIKLWTKLDEKDKDHKEDRREWFKKLDEMIDKQNNTVKQVGENHDEALKELTDKYDKRQGEINDTFLNAFKQAFGKR